ncbi:Calx-beta domain-containing protein [Pontixanthobacter aestiaquae]
MYFFVTLSSPHNTSASVAYATSYGSAGPNDFQATSGTLNFSAGETSKWILITTSQDLFIESPETFAFNLSSPSGGVTISDGAAVGTIIDDDDCGVSCQ